MPDYNPPLADMQFLLQSVIGLDKLAEHPDLGKLDGEMVESVLTPAAKLASEVLAPLNWTGDQEGAVLKDGVVTTAAGFAQAYAAYRDGGWNAVPFASDYGGQNLPWSVAFPLQEMWQGANMAFGLCPLLNQGAVEAIYTHGTDQQKEYYLEKLISGEWTGTMNLTEPQAGSDLSAIRAKAEPQGDGSYKISGQKIYITYGEHDMAENIIHLVLARTPDAPEGVKGISLFIVPKFLEDGTRNDVLCTGIEHKLGIHASPTCTMQFGDKGGAVGFLVGAENEGLKYMFTMMNNARLSVGLQGVAIAERATQAALAYAKDRTQGASLSDRTPNVAIIEHADVKRMVLSMMAQTQALRALTYQAAHYLDMAHQGAAGAQARVDLLTPIVKAYGTDMALDVTSTGVQIHGGMGFVEETGAAQYYRDARILPIYEGTNGIQAADLAFRKILKDGGVAATAYIEEMSATMEAFAKEAPKVQAEILSAALDDLHGATEWVLAEGTKDLNKIAAASVAYLKLFGVVAAGEMMVKSITHAKRLMSEGGSDKKFLQQKIQIAEFYILHIVPQAGGLKTSIIEGGAPILEMAFD